MFYYLDIDVLVYLRKCSEAQRSDKYFDTSCKAVFVQFSFFFFVLFPPFISLFTLFFGLDLHNVGQPLLMAMHDVIA